MCHLLDVLSFAIVAAARELGVNVVRRPI